MVMISPQINVSLVPGGDLAPWQGQALGEWAEPHPGTSAPCRLWWRLGRLSGSWAQEMNREEPAGG